MSGNDDLKSRFEIYLEAALNSIEVDGLPKPISRADQYLLALIAKMREMGSSLERIDETFQDLTGTSVMSVIMRRNIYRGKNLGTSVTPAQKTAITTGTFEDMYVGDYWVINGVTWRIADINYWYNCGDTIFTKNHLVMVPDSPLYATKMNETDITTGGYVGSKMYTEGLNQAKTTIQTAFRDLLLTHRDFLINAVTNGYHFVGAWFDSTVELMNEIMVYGSYIYTPGSTGSIFIHRATINKQQLALFSLNPGMINRRQFFWLRDVSSSTHFAMVYDRGSAFCTPASSSYGVRPVFAIG
jgi:hypothetical protein